MSAGAGAAFAILGRMNGGRRADETHFSLLRRRRVDDFVHFERRLRLDLLRLWLARLLGVNASNVVDVVVVVVVVVVTACGSTIDEERRWLRVSSG